MAESGLALTGVGRSPGKNQVLVDIDLHIAPGEVFTLAGPSGSGKSTLLRLIAGLEPADTGRISLGDRVLNGPGKATPPWQRGIGMVFQDYLLFPYMNVRRNIAMALPGTGRRERRRETDRILDLLQIRHLARRLPDRLSGGEQQRVALGRALAGRPQLLLLDEPFSNLDRPTLDGLRPVLRDLIHDLNITTLLVTHDRSEAFGLGHRTGILLGGRLRCTGSPAEVYHQFADEEVARFAGPVNRISPGDLLTCFGLRADGPLLCRPEDLRLLEEEAGPAVDVISTELTGHGCALELRLPGGSEVRLWHGGRPPAGKHVHIGLSSQAAGRAALPGAV